jgi:ABC-type uncharacterized transport system permease subunit
MLQKNSWGYGWLVLQHHIEQGELKMSLEFRQKPMKVRTVVGAIVIGILIGAVIVLLSGNNPAYVYAKLLKGSFGSAFAISSTLRWSTPLLFTAVASAISFRGGMFNMGVEGQLYLGAMAATIVGISYNGPHILTVVLCFMAAVIAGTLYALIPAFMRVYLKANEIVTTLMLNYVAINLTNYLTKTFFLSRDSMGDSLATRELYESAKLTKLVPPYSVTTGLLMGLLMVMLFYIYMNKSVKGYEVHISGVNPDFSRYGGISVDKVRISVMLISGAIAGLGGAAEIMGVQGRFISKFSPDFGFDGMLTALLGNSTPLGVTLSAIFMGALKAGALSIERTTNVSRALADVIKGIVICFVSVRTLGIFDRIKLPKFTRRKKSEVKEA